MKKKYKTSGKGLKDAVSYGINFRQSIVEGFRRIKHETGKHAYEVIAEALAHYETKISGESKFTAGGEMMECKCNHERRWCLKHPIYGRLVNRNIYLNRTFRKNLIKRAHQRNTSMSAFVQAMLLTYANELEGRHLVFCDMCLRPVGNVEVLFFENSADSIYSIHPNQTVGKTIWHQYGHKQPQHLILTGHANKLYETGFTSGLRKIVAKTHDNVDQTRLQELLNGWDMEFKKFHGEGLIELKDGQYLATRKCIPPRLI